MDTPLKIRSLGGASPATGSGQQSATRHSITIPGRPREVSGARAFIARTLSATGKDASVDTETTALLTSELVTNALLHTASGGPGGVITVTIVDVPDGVLVEVTDDGGSAGVPTVRNDLFSANGRGLYLVKQIAAQWGYLRDRAGTTVWFHLAATVPAAS